MIRLVWKSSPPKRRGIEVRKHQPISGIRQRRRIACLVRPGLKVHGLSGTDADQDSQDFRLGCPLRHRGVKAVAPLFDRRKMESRRVGDRLEVVRGAKVGIASGDCRKTPRAKQIGDCLGKRERWIKIRIVGAAAVPSPPTGVQSELHEVGESRLAAGASRCTAR